ncbi:lysophospholipase [Opitutaceae bacterium EW11]|nr:lysophospholipase [Opitutaceae bacterium EW11]
MIPSPITSLVRATAFGILTFAAAFTGLPRLVAADDARPVEDSSKIATQEVRDKSLPTIFLVGDSTVKVGTKGQKGWGEVIAPYFDLSKVNVVNRAIGGRSSRTFQTEGRWDRVLADLKAGDVVIIQFGHNDAGALNDNSRARGTIKGVGEESQEIDNLLTKKHEVVHSYGWYLRKYVADTKSKGALPIVCSLVPRKIWTPDGRVARAKDSYAGWAADVAKSAGVPFLDLNEIIAEQYEKLGKEQVDALFADAHTHTTEAGARASARCVIAGLKALPGNPVAPYLSKEGQAVEPAAVH